MRYVSQPVKKLDGMPIIKGKPLYTNDLAPNECLIVLALRSPYACLLYTSPSPRDCS